ncbi:MAG: hypothetical protein HYV07_24385 [Deltaproteobacteria bacterium]|nr:hypothetical protein [Deltaproteobacteria bacterium]
MGYVPPRFEMAFIRWILAATLGSVSCAHVAPDPKLVAEGERLAKSVVGELNSARRKRGVTLAEYVDEFAERAVRIASALEAGELRPSDAAHEMAADLRHLTGAGVVKYWVLEASSIEELSFPAELVEAPSISVAPIVATLPGRGGATSWLVVLLALDPTEPPTADGFGNLGE